MQANDIKLLPHRKAPPSQTAQYSQSKDGRWCQIGCDSANTLWTGDLGVTQDTARCVAGSGGVRGGKNLGEETTECS